jgi:F0F1-type ATP synthase delta subunit
MTSPALFDQLISQLRLTSEVEEVLNCLEEFASTFFSAKTTEEQKLIFSALPQQIAEILLTAFTKQPITPENQIAVKREIDELSDKLRTCKSIQLTIAFKADDAAITLFSDWIKENVKSDLLIDLKFDKSIVGGVLLISGGKFKDYSVRKNLSNRFQIQRDEILSLLT